MAKTETPTPTHGVIYTDGGSDKNGQGVGGWGLHGYTYLPEVPKTGAGIKDHVPTAKGYFEKVGKGKDVQGKGPSGPIDQVTVVEYLDGVGSLIPKATNNVAELTAGLKAFQLVKEMGLKDVLIRPDSNYFLQGCTEWMENWERKGWQRPDGTEIANKELWQEILAIYRELAENGIDIRWLKVKGHSGEWGNEMADANATAGKVAGNGGHEIDITTRTDAKGYWNQKVEVSRFFDRRNWYFNTNFGDIPTTDDGYYVYHQGDHGSEDDFYFKPASDVNLSVIQLKKPEPVLEIIRQKQNAVDPTLSREFVIGRLDNLFHPRCYQNVERHKDVFLQVQGFKNDLYDRENNLLTRVLRPPLLAFRSIEYFSVLERILNDVCSGKHDGYEITDITAELYETVGSGKKEALKLKADLTSAVKSISPKIKYDTGKLKGCEELTLTVGIDTPTRNALAALASERPTVRVVSWSESPQAFRYATIVEAAESRGIWAGFYSNLRLLTT